MKSQCPLCHKVHDSEDHDVGWYFVCCVILVWEKVGDELELQIAPSPPNDFEES